MPSPRREVNQKPCSFLICISDFDFQRGKFKCPGAKSGCYGERRALRVHVALPSLTFNLPVRPLRGLSRARSGDSAMVGNSKKAIVYCISENHFTTFVERFFAALIAFLLLLAHFFLCSIFWHSVFCRIELYTCMSLVGRV